MSISKLSWSTCGIIHKDVFYRLTTCDIIRVSGRIWSGICHTDITKGARLLTTFQPSGRKTWYTSPFEETAPSLTSLVSLVLFCEHKTFYTLRPPQACHGTCAPASAHKHFFFNASRKVIISRPPSFLLALQPLWPHLLWTFYLGVIIWELAFYA